MKTVDFDPEKHKGYQLLLRTFDGEHVVMRVPPDQVPALRANGWKTAKEWEEIEGRRARKHVAKMVRGGATPQEVAEYIDKCWREGLRLGVYEPGPIESEETVRRLQEVMKEQGMAGVVSVHRPQEPAGDVEGLTGEREVDIPQPPSAEAQG